MPASYWEELGIAPTTDRLRIRRAYAVRLKAIFPDHDPAAFQRLRTAYESALRDAAQPERVPAPEPDPLPDEHEADPAAEQARAAITAARDREDPAGAIAAYERGEDLGLLSLADLEAIEDRMLTVTVADRTLSPDRFGQIVRRFQWDNSIHPLRRRRAQVFVTLDQRLDAERWYGELVERAQRARGIYPSDDGLAARQLLAGPPTWWNRYGFHNRSPWLGRDLAAFDRHGEWLAGRFDPARISWCRGRKANRKAQRAAAVIWVAFGLFSILVTAKGPGVLFFFIFIVVVGLVIYLVHHSRTGGVR